MMHEGGEIHLPEETFRQSLAIALNVSQRLQERNESLQKAGGSAYVRHVWSDAQTLERIEVFELLAAARNTDPADMFTMPYKNTVLTYHHWDSTDLETEPPEQQMKTARYLPVGYTLTIDDFRGRAGSIGSIFEPFFDLDRCATTEQKHDLLQAVSATGAENEPEMKRVARKFRSNILKRCTAQEIADYAAMSKDIPRLPEPLSKEKISELANRKVIRDHTNSQGQYRAQLTLEQTDESVRALDATGLIDETIFSSLQAYHMLSLSEALHSRLYSEKCGRTVAHLGQGPAAFALQYMHTILNTHDEKPERRSLSNAIPQEVRTDPSTIMATANAILSVVNRERTPDKQIHMLREKNICDIPPALIVIFNATRTGTDEERSIQARQDQVHVEIIAKLLELATRRQIGHVVMPS